jgi:5-methylcytosine-specific restriction endonuclease McrBC GTP-binding regulatory subunit McrB
MLGKGKDKINKGGGMMAKIEEILNNWKWDEEKIRKYLEEFERFLNSEKGQNDVKNRREKLRKAQELLKDEESIESLTSEKLSELLKGTEAYRGKRRPASRIEREDEEFFKEFKAWLKNLINVKLQDPLPEKRPEDVSTGYASELLTLRNPKEFYLINNASIDGLRKLGFGKLPSNDEESYPKWRPLFDELIEKIKPIIEKNLNREVDYYDVDQFLYFVSEQNGKSKNNKTDESQDKNKESSNIAETVKESDTKNELTLHKYFQYKGFYFDQALITAFYSALKTKGFVILSGLTGTGKTKLAQLFAEIFEIEKIKEKTDEKYLSFAIEVSPYMLLYNRIHLPKRSYEILNLVDTEKEKYVKVIGGNEEEICKIVKYTADRYPYTLLLKGKVAKWFKDNFKEKEKLQIEVVPAEDNENVILVLKKLEPEKRQIEKKPAYMFLSVRPDWRDSKALLGYYNPITKEYERMPLLNFILDAIKNYHTNKDNPDPFFIILDEMNLSHVEYYFADFLSVLESGRDENYWTKETIKLHNSEEPLLDNNGKEIPKEIKLPPNLYIIGSVNIDETTYMFSPKVLDRAFTIEFREVNFDNYRQFEIDKEKAKSIGDSIRNILLEDLRNKKNGKARFYGPLADKEEIKEALNWIKKNKVRSKKSIFDELKELNHILQPYDLHFGYRVLDEIALFIKYATNAPATKAPDKTNAPNVVGKLSPEDALDFAVLMKVLPKFHGPRQKLERPLWLVLGWCLVKSAEFDNKTFDDLIIGIWKELSDRDKRPNIEDLTYVIQKLKSELNNRSKNESKEANLGSQTIDKKQNQTTEESPELTSEAHQTEQTSKDNNTTIIDKVKYPRTAIKVLTMLRQLYETGFTSFA